MMRMNAEKNGDKVIEKEGWREASCGTVTPRDDDGNRLLSRYIGHLPEEKKTAQFLNRRYIPNFRYNRGQIWERL